MVLSVMLNYNCITAMFYVAFFYCHILAAINAYNDNLFSVPERIPIGALFPHGANYLQLVFKQTIHQHNSNTSLNFIVETATEFVDLNDPTSAVRQLQCLHFNRGIYAFLASNFGAFTYKSALSFANAYMVPYIGVSPLFAINEKSNYNDHKEVYGINLEPNHWPAIISVLKWYQWNKIIYLYDSDYGVFNLQEMLKYAHNSNHELRLTIVKRVNNAGDGYRALKSLDTSDSDSFKYVIVNCNHHISKAIIAYHIQDNDMKKHTFHYLLTNLMLNDSWSREVPAAFNAVNITSFAVPAVKRELKKLSQIKATASDGQQQRDNEIPTLEESLVYDGTKVLLEAFNIIIRSRINITKALESDTAIISTANFTRKDIDLTCPTLKPFKFGHIIANHLRLTSLLGITGYIQFDSNGLRRNYTIEIFQTSNSGYFEKIALWSDLSGLTVEHNDRLNFHDSDIYNKQNLTLIVTSILEEPFLIRADLKNGQSLSGNDRYIGYLKDLTDMLANELDMSYSIALVNDSKYGSMSDSGWNGMIQELIENRVDMAIAPLTITAHRQKVVDFTQPFMTTGISIMIKKPNAYSIAMPFLNPLPKEVWAIIILAFFAVTVIFYIASRLSFKHDVSDSDSDTNRVSVCSSLWYSFGVLVYQVSGFFPNSISSRIISSVWWLFAFISVTTYLTNLTAQSVANRMQSTLLNVLGNYDLSSDALLYKEQMILPILSAEDLIKQNRIEYGTLIDSSTQLFFKNSFVKTYSQMWNHMSQKNNVFVSSYRQGIEKVRQSEGKYAFLLEAAMNEYTNDREPCDTIKIGKNLNQVDYGIALPLGSPLRERLNIAILKFREQGDLTKLQHKWWNDRSQCQLVRHRILEQSSTETTFYNIFFGVIILAIGLVLAFFISIIEFFLNRKVSYNTSRRSDYTPAVQDEKLIEEDSDTPKQTKIIKRSIKEI